MRNQKTQWSLKTRLTIGYTCSLLLLVLAATTFVYWGLRRVVDQTDNAVLRERIQVLGGLLRSGHEPRGFQGLSYARILSSQEHILLETPQMAQLLPAAIFHSPVSSGAPERVDKISIPGGRQFQVMTASVEGSQPDEYWTVQAALELPEEDPLSKEYRTLLALVVVLAPLIGLVLGNRITQGGMRPLAKIAETTRRVATSTLSERLSLEGLPTELVSLADNVNGMLGRLENSFLRLSQFSADMAHELRTVLSNLRGEAEVALSDRRPDAQYREVIASSLEEYAYLTKIVDNLLFIATAENSEAVIQRERIGLAKELQSVTEFYEPMASEKGIHIRLDVSPELYADLDACLFRRAVANLVSNAITYTQPAGTVSVSAMRSDTALRVEVADTGIGIAPEHLPHIFDRFYRVDRRRRGDSSGAGLGLSIVKTIMELHGGSVTLQSAPGQGTRVTLVFPLEQKS